MKLLASVREWDKRWDLMLVTILKRERGREIVFLLDHRYQNINDATNKCVDGFLDVVHRWNSCKAHEACRGSGHGFLDVRVSLVCLCWCFSLVSRCSLRVNTDGSAAGRESFRRGGVIFLNLNGQPYKRVSTRATTRESGVSELSHGDTTSGAAVERIPARRSSLIRIHETGDEHLDIFEPEQESSCLLERCLLALLWKATGEVVWIRGPAISTNSEIDLW